MKKILIAIPAQDMIHTAFVQSILSLRVPGGVKISYGMVLNSLVYDARNALAAQAVNEDADYILWLDSDMTFEPDMLERMLADDKEIVCGLFFRRRPPFSPCIYKTLRADREYPERNVFEKQFAYPDEIFTVEGCGMAAVLMSTDVLRKIALNEMRDGRKAIPPFVPLLGFGEDLSFCIRAREAGCEIWCDPQIKIGHMASLVVDESVWKASRVAVV